MKVIETFKNTTSLWKIIETETGYISAAIYDGLKFFDKKFNLLNEIKTKSICYAVCKIDNRIFYSSFYQKTVYVIKQ
ncbi:hypothetical protein A0H76_991 [Hepatospora eriocheir]|uniref:Uncharacterized protein n=1 Tax=Hepatospora eriocheir TaxID=1081669 RepID=A0A1X0Q6A8_9MICR|nr:hypothetical protein A0H76_991 [Hepatospora eriocheir]